jgi:H+/Cl- antiporter ClcA
MKIDKLLEYIFFIIVGIGLILYAIYVKKDLKKKDSYSARDSVTNFGAVFLGIGIILVELINILSLL